MRAIDIGFLDLADPVHHACCSGKEALQKTLAASSKSIVNETSEPLSF